MNYGCIKTDDEKIFRRFDEIQEYYFPNKYRKRMMSNPKRFAKYIIDEIIKEVYNIIN